LSQILTYPPTASIISALTQAGYKTAWLIDDQNNAAFNDVMDPDIVYDSTDLGPYGGRTSGLEQTTAAIKGAGNGARTSRLVTNLLVLDVMTPEKAKVNT
jgi:hypothetical protein